MFSSIQFSLPIFQIFYSNFLNLLILKCYFIFVYCISLISFDKWQFVVNLLGILFSFFSSSPDSFLLSFLHYIAIDLISSSGFTDIGILSLPYFFQKLSKVYFFFTLARRSFWTENWCRVSKELCFLFLISTLHFLSLSWI